MLSIKNLVKTFDDKKVLNNVSFEVSPGQVVVLLGESGVGKSTVLRVLNNLETYDQGSVILNEKPINFLKIGIVFQDFNLFNHLTIEENITLPLMKVLQKSKQEAQKRAYDLLERFGLRSKASTYPSSLSGGQKQRVALARSLAMNPAVLCLDEPTSALDPTLKKEIAKIIQNLAKQGLMIIITTHDVALIQQLDCIIYLMQDGKIIEKATTSCLQKNLESCKNIKNFMQVK